MITYCLCLVNNIFYLCLATSCLWVCGVIDQADDNLILLLPCLIVSVREIHVCLVFSVARTWICRVWVRTAWALQ